MVRRWRARGGGRRGTVEGDSAAAPAAGATAASLPAHASVLPALEIASGSRSRSSSSSSRSPAAKVKSKGSTSSSSPQAKEKAAASSSSSSSSTIPPSLPPSPELQALLEEKKGIKTRLKRFDTSFQAKHGRAPSKQEKEPVRSVYEKYNRLKGRIAALEQKQKQEKEVSLARGRTGGSSSRTSRGSSSSSLTRPTAASASRARMTAGGREGGKEGGGGGLPPQSPRRSSSPSSGFSLFRAHDHSKSVPRTATTLTNSSSSSNSGTGATPPTSPRSPIAAASSAASAFPSHFASTPPPAPPPSSLRSSERTLPHLRPTHIPTSDGNLVDSSSSTARPSNPSVFASSVVSSKRPVARAALSSSFPPSASGPASEVDVLLLEKKRLHAHLRKFERAFQKEHGRRVLTAGDILPVDEQYKRYKRVKAQLAQLGVVGKKERGQGKGGSRGNN